MKAYSIVTSVHAIKLKTVLLGMSQLTNNTPIKIQRLSYLIKKEARTICGLQKQTKQK